MAEIWAIILAAGESERMDKNKLLLPFKGKTIIETVIDNIRQSIIDKIMIITGAFKDDMIKIIKQLPLKNCYNEEYKKGMLSSVQCGFKNIPGEPDIVLIFLADQPDISPEIINLLITNYKEFKKGIVIPAYKGHRGHPLLIDWKYRSIIEKLNPKIGLRDLLFKYPEDILEVTVESSGILMDVDTPKDYLNLTNFK